jgi:hypothetical protein
LHKLKKKFENRITKSKVIKILPVNLISVPGVYQVKEGKSGYFGAIYINDEIQQVVLARQGTDSLGAISEDTRGIFIQ